ncbi:hypothetical protein TD95_002205 [Thielaviopsis punctulata]|uniref:rRNA biogenesis protein RRP36 n=1 Tax=Thielaviopsis punctulata TaxID=72032 RepID=A0A0F4ZEU1_9PEZI|nr:hypothetical protein TD95_002205 [Thielaviopsis punctulata]
MPLGKRKPASAPAARRVRPRKEPEYAQSDSDAPSEEQLGPSDAGSDEEAEEEEEEVDYDSDAEIPTAEPSATPSLAAVSFGDLAKAQAALDKLKRKEKRQAERAAARNTAPAFGSAGAPPTKRPSSAPAQRAPPAKRSSKHAPQEMSSKRPVPRKRDFGEPAQKAVARDPRFDPLAGEVNERLIRKAYGFLNEYRASEIAELKTRIRKCKSDEEKERLKRELLVLESKRRTQERKDHAQDVIDEHKRKEKELVAQGKTPFYLKKAELKKKVLVDRFENMSKRDVDKAIMRKRKKVAGKEKKELASMERVDGSMRRGW